MLIIFVSNDFYLSTGYFFTDSIHPFPCNTSYRTAPCSVHSLQNLVSYIVTASSKCNSGLYIHSIRPRPQQRSVPPLRPTPTFPGSCQRGLISPFTRVSVRNVLAKCIARTRDVAADATSIVDILMCLHMHTQIVLVAELFPTDQAGCKQLASTGAGCLRGARRGGAKLEGRKVRTWTQMNSIGCCCCGCCIWTKISTTRIFRRRGVFSCGDNEYSNYKT